MSALIFAALLAGQAVATDPPLDDRAAVMTSILNEFAGNQRVPHRRPAGRRICVVPKLTDMPLAGSRQPSPNDAKFDAPIGKPRLPWKADTEEEARERLWWVDPDLPQEQKKAQQAIKDAALHASEKHDDPSLSHRVEQAWLSPNQFTGSDDCPETIELSEPNIALDHAFIWVRIDCGVLCGLGGLFVMRRQDKQWSIVDWRLSFIS